MNGNVVGTTMPDLALQQLALPLSQHIGITLNRMIEGVDELFVIRLEFRALHQKVGHEFAGFITKMGLLTHTEQRNSRMPNVLRVREVQHIRLVGNYRPGHNLVVLR